MIVMHTQHTHIYVSHQGWDSSTFTRISVEQKLKSVVDDYHFRKRKNQQQNQKQSKSIYGLSAFYRVLKLFPDVRTSCIVVLASENGHANRHHHSWEKF